jgi:reactive intermediate/imine deaminase
MRRLVVGIGVAITIAACGGSSAPPAVEYYPVAGQTGLPFSEAVRVGPMLYLSGQIGTDASGQVVPGGIDAETRQTFANIRAILERHGSSLDRVVKCTAMLADMSEWAKMNAVYVTYFQKQLPARSAFGATALARGARIELECWATVGK